MKHAAFLLKFIANWGALATQDKLIQILLELDSSDLSQHNEQCLDIVDDNLNINTLDIIKLL
ncbi:MAG TPA: hypothetical protein VLG38_07790 [Gammaproteobacteria bacterium]|nr:hypothetical protein [Gammaproteobacteria bacterium]